MSRKGHGESQSMTQNNGGGKMRKWRFVTMLMVACLMLGGCGGGSESKLAAESHEDDYGSEDTSYEEGFSYETEEDTSEEGLVEDEYSAEDDEPKTEEPEKTEPAEAKGIIAMVRQTQISASGGYTDVQIISIDPETGVQSIVSEFHLDHLTYAEQKRASEIDNDVEFYYAPPEEISVYNNNRDWFSDDFTKMKADRTYVTNSSEFHAGWIDSDGVFFDVTEAIGAVEEDSFSSHTASQKSKGFVDGMFAFHEYPDGKDYYVPIDNASSDGLYEVDEDDWYSYRYKRRGYELWYPTYKIDDNTYITDANASGARCPNSIIVDIRTNETKYYLPDSERYNWGGVLSPSGDTVAFLSVKHGAHEAIELYTVPLAGGEPEKIPIIPNGELLRDITTLTSNDLPLTVSLPEQCCYSLIGWK